MLMTSDVAFQSPPRNWTTASSVYGSGGRKIWNEALPPSHGCTGTRPAAVKGCCWPLGQDAFRSLACTGWTSAEISLLLAQVGRNQLHGAHVRRLHEALDAALGFAGLTVSWSTPLAAAGQRRIRLLFQLAGGRPEGIAEHCRFWVALGRRSESPRKPTQDAMSLRGVNECHTCNSLRLKGQHVDSVTCIVELSHPNWFAPVFVVSSSAEKEACRLSESNDQTRFQDRNLDSHE